MNLLKTKKKWNSAVNFFVMFISSYKAPILSLNGLLPSYLNFLKVRYKRTGGVTTTNDKLTQENIDANCSVEFTNLI